MGSVNLNNLLCTLNIIRLNEGSLFAKVDEIGKRMTTTESPHKASNPEEIGRFLVDVATHSDLSSKEINLLQNGFNCIKKVHEAASRILPSTEEEPENDESSCESRTEKTRLEKLDDELQFLRARAQIDECCAKEFLETLFPEHKQFIVSKLIADKNISYESLIKAVRRISACAMEKLETLCKKLERPEDLECSESGKESKNYRKLKILLIGKVEFSLFSSRVCYTPFEEVKKTGERLRLEEKHEATKTRTDFPSMHGVKHFTKPSFTNLNYSTSKLNEASLCSAILKEIIHSTLKLSETISNSNKLINELNSELYNPNITLEEITQKALSVKKSMYETLIYGIRLLTLEIDENKAEMRKAWNNLLERNNFVYIFNDNTLELLRSGERERCIFKEYDPIPDTLSLDNLYFIDEALRNAIFSVSDLVRKGKISPENAKNEVIPSMINYFSKSEEPLEKGKVDLIAMILKLFLYKFPISYMAVETHFANMANDSAEDCKAENKVEKEHETQELNDPLYVL